MARKIAKPRGKATRKRSYIVSPRTKRGRLWDKLWRPENAKPGKVKTISEEEYKRSTKPDDD